PKRFAPSVIRSGVRTAALLIAVLSAPASSVSRMSSTVRSPPPTPNGMKIASATCRTTSSLVSRPSCVALMSSRISSSAPSASYTCACSTGSPASTRLTKFTPLTTRPPCTSRQGMLRLASTALLLDGLRACCHLDRLGEVHRAAVQRAANHHAGDRAFLQRFARHPQRLHILQGRHAAGGDDVQPGLAGKLGRRLDVHAAQLAVPRDVGVERVPHAHVGEALAQLYRRPARLLLPAMDHDLPLLGVKRDDNRLRPDGIESVLRDVRQADNQRAEHHARRARVEHLADLVYVAQAAAELDLRPDASQLAQGIKVKVGVVERPIEVDHVNPLGPCVLPAVRHLDRVVAVRDAAVGVALSQAHDLPAVNVNCRVYNHQLLSPPIPYQ